MKSGPIFFFGLFAALAISWAGIVLGTHGQLGALAPYYDDTEGKSFPDRPTGIAARGQLVYADLGCASCHTQQVRRPDFGSDQARGWGERQSVARDYIHQARPQLGASRIGPDLTNLAGRKPSALDAEDLLKLLYAGTPTHPSFKFLFATRPIMGEPSLKALRLTGNLAPAAGNEVVPSERAQALVAHLLGLNNVYDYPESRPVPHPAPAGAAAHGQPEGKAAAPDTKGIAPAPDAKGATPATDAKAPAPGAKGATPVPDAKSKSDQSAPATVVAPAAKKEEGKK